MELREIWLRFTSWLRNQLPPSRSDYERPQLSDDGLIIQNQPPSADKSPFQAVAVRGKPEVEKFQAGFETLIDQIQNINEHLNKQVAQHENLIARIEQFPKLLENFPAVVENQKVLTEQLVSQLKTNLLKDQQLLSAVEKIPAESAKQTDALQAIDRQLAAASDVDIQMTETFGKFNETLAKLNQSTRDHTDGIAQMSRTFAASDRYLKFIVTRQTRQLMWVFYSALGICIAVILILVGIIIFVNK
jgi:DNA repair exonuclease SbcCD ATPase subunit